MSQYLVIRNDRGEYYDQKYNAWSKKLNTRCLFHREEDVRYRIERIGLQNPYHRCRIINAHIEASNR